MESIRNIAFMAHVDAGKTTLTEQVLYHAGAIRALGFVDDGTAKTDDLIVERQRGISVRSAFASLLWRGVTVNIIDTPGHSDFYSQTERAFLAADAIVVLVSAVDGVQAGTENIVLHAADHHMPICFFINKCDRDTARLDEVVAQIKDLQKGAFVYDRERYETAALYDDKLMQAFLDDKPEDRTGVDLILQREMRRCEVAPVLYGSAATGDGVGALLDFICDLVPSRDAVMQEAEPSGILFSVTHDKTFGRGAYIRMFAGRVSVRDTLTMRGQSVKISIIQKQTEGRWHHADELKAGEIALVYGLTDCRTGDFFGDSQHIPPHALRGLTAKALLTVQITPRNSADYTALKAALDMMTAEDPTLGFIWHPASREMHIQVMGVIQMEVLSALLEERFTIPVDIGEPSVIYKETLRQAAIGFDAYTMPKPSWAVLTFQLTPAPRGSGVTYRCTAAPKRIPYRYRGQVEQSILPSLKQGLYGWEVTDLDINLVDGEDHPVHTHPLDFTIATPLALFDGLRKGGTVLLEPVMDVKFSFEARLLGKVMSDIVRMRGQAQSPAHHGDNVVLRAKLPLATSLDYPVAFASLTSGHGIMTQRLFGYEECPLSLGKTCPRRGVDPLDRSKYILAARQSLTGTIFET